MTPLAAVVLLFAQAGGAGPVDLAPPNGPAAVAARAPLVIPTPRPRPPDIPSYRVSARMKSGRRFAGVVCRDNAFHAIVHAGQHHTQTPYALDQRFKLRFVDGLDGEISLRWRDVQKLEVRDILDSAGVRVMENEYASARLVRGRGVEALEGPTLGDVAPPVPPIEAEGEPAAPAKDLVTSKLSLLDEFAPALGWTPERKRQIEWRRTVVGAFPDEREARFLAVYDQWEPLFLDWTVEEQRRVAQAAADGKSAAPRVRAPDPKSAEPVPAKERVPPAGVDPKPKGERAKDGATDR